MTTSNPVPDQTAPAQHPAIEAHVVDYAAPTDNPECIDDCPACEAGIEHDAHCLTPETHNWGCGCPTDQAPAARAEEDACRVVEVGGEPIRVRGAGELTEQGRTALASLVGAARRKHAAEQAQHDNQVRAAALREAADLIDNDDTCGCGGCDSCTARKDAARLRARADEISGQNTQAGGEQA